MNDILQCKFTFVNGTGYMVLYENQEDKNGYTTEVFLKSYIIARNLVAFDRSVRELTNSSLVVFVRSLLEMNIRTYKSKRVQKIITNILRQ